MKALHLAQLDQRFGTILADPPWRFDWRTGKGATEHKRLFQYETMALDEIAALPVKSVAAEQSHLYLWVPNVLLPFGLEVLKAWGFEYRTTVIWFKVAADGTADASGRGWSFRNATEIILFGSRGGCKTLEPARSQTNTIVAHKREHSRKPDEQYALIEACSPGPYLELFARAHRPGWTVWGEEAPEQSSYETGLLSQTLEVIR